MNPPDSPTPPPSGTNITDNKVGNDNQVAAGSNINQVKAIQTVVTGSGSTVSKVEQTIKELHLHSAPDPDAAERARLLALRDRYLRNVVLPQTRFLDLGAVDSRASDQCPDEMIQLELSAIYTPLHVLGSRDRERDPAQPRPDTREPVAKFAARHRLAALLGDPGSGKTTVINLLALAHAGALLGEEKIGLALLGGKDNGWEPPALLPVRVILRDFAEWHTRHTPPADPSVPVLPGNRLLAFIRTRLVPPADSRNPTAKETDDARLLSDSLGDSTLLLLDGLDEVPEGGALRDLIRDQATGWARRFPRSRVFLTSRIYAWHRQGWSLPGFATATLAPFDAEQIYIFSHQWHAHRASFPQSRLRPEDAAGRSADLVGRIRRSANLQEMAGSPLLLTLMASLHARPGRPLPENREQLYDESLALLLHVWEMSKRPPGPGGAAASTLAEFLKITEEQAMKALEQIAFDAHSRQPGAESGAANIEVGSILKILRKAAPHAIGQVETYFRDRAGLLIDRGAGEIYAFAHRTFQEYLAARHLSDDPDYPDKLVALLRADGARWRETLLLAGAKASRGAKKAAWDLVHALLADLPDGDGPLEEPDALCVHLAAEVLAECDLDPKKPPTSYRTVLSAHPRHLARLCAHGSLSPVAGAAAARHLAALGDPRPIVAGQPLRLIVPSSEGDPVEEAIRVFTNEHTWSKVIPLGEFTMGDDPEARGGAAFYRCRLTQPYRLACWPVTVAQYDLFLRAGGYQDKQWWTAGGHGHFTGPRDSAPIFQTPSHPVIGISWYESVAFCQWLSHITGWVITLPTEAQWERAARNGDGRGYSWPGAEDEFAARCNMGYTEINATSAVGIFPAGAAECGAQDMAGNVWEWCHDWHGGYPSGPKTDYRGAESGSNRVRRGGSWGAGASSTRAANRFANDPSDCFNSLGFRPAAVLA